MAMAMRTRRAAIGDCEFAVRFRDDRRLKDADGPDAGGKRRVGHFAGLDVAGIVGILFQDAGIDATQFHLFSPVSSHRGLSSKTKPGERGRTGRGKGGAKRRDFGPLERKRRDGPTLCGGRASRALS